MRPTDSITPLSQSQQISIKDFWGGALCAKAHIKRMPPWDLRNLRY